MAEATAAALVLAEAQGLGSHGLSRVAQYATHLRNGRVDGQAVPHVARSKGAVAVVDAGEGLAFPACALAVDEAMRRAKEFGIGFVGVVRSHHAGVIVDHLRPAAREGFVGLGFANSPAAMPAAGGRHPIFGTNPVAAIFPRRGAAAGDRPQPQRGGARQGDGRGQGRPADPARLGARRRRPADDRREGRARRLDARRRRRLEQQGSDAGAGRRAVRQRADRRPLRLRGLELLRRRGQPAAASARPSWSSIRARLQAARPSSTASRCWSREMLVDDGVRLPGARREALASRAEQEGLVVGDAVLASLAA